IQILLFLSSSGLFLESRESHTCGIGFKSENKSCVDTDECVMDPGVCGNHAQCFNTPGSYYCNCDEGFQSTPPNFTQTTGQCLDINECLVGTYECPGDLECVNTIGSFNCSCPKGYKTSRLDADVDECLSSVCGVHSSCFNTAGGFLCTCSPGFVEHENSTCADIDECKDNLDICGTNAQCRNKVGSYNCECHQGYSNYGNNQSKCIEMSCDQFKAESDVESTPETLKHLRALLRSSCESLRTANGSRKTGEQLLENVFTSTDELLSEGNIADSETLNQFLDVVENSMRLIGPQLKEPVTRMETHNTFAEVAVMRGQTPPSGRVTLRTDSALFSTSWETVVGKSYPGFVFAALVSYKDLNSFRDLLHKMSRERPDDEERSVTYQLNSKVVTAVVSNAETKQLSEPVMLVFTHEEERAESEGVAYSCVYWDEGAWSGRGCERAWSNSTHTACSCSHLSSFAVLMALYPVQDTFELVLMTHLGLALSLVCLFLCILTFKFCRSIQGTRTSIHLHLSISLFIADLVFLCGISSTHNQVACRIVAGLLHFFFLSAFFPLVIVIISAIAFPAGYGTDRHCWLSLDQNFIWSFLAPVCIIVVLNSFVFTITVWKLAEKFSSLNPDLSKLRNIKGFTVTAVAQFCILGGTWVFGSFLFYEKVTQVALYLFTILNSLQGAIIFIMHCLLSKPVLTHKEMHNAPKRQSSLDSNYILKISPAHSQTSDSLYEAFHRILAKSHQCVFNVFCRPLQVRDEYYKLISRICSLKEKKYSEFSTNHSSNSQVHHR
uniref:Adhesion G protein-coupled receptor E1 n=1 Tax=Cyprinus carpio TaxID=7962 RepID=A0A8C1X199_CYPCA